MQVARQEVGGVITNSLAGVLHTLRNVATLAMDDLVLGVSRRVVNLA